MRTMILRPEAARRHVGPFVTQSPGAVVRDRLHMSGQTSLSHQPAPIEVLHAPPSSADAATNATAIEAALLAPGRPAGGFASFVSRVMDMCDSAGPAQRYGMAVCLALTGALIALLLDLGEVTVGVLSAPVLVIVLATFVAGPRPGLLATFMTVALVESFILQPPFDLGIDRPEVIGFIVLACAALTGLALSLALRQARSRALELADQRQQLLRAVLEGEQQLQSMADAMPVLVARASVEGDVDYYNRVLLEYAGKTADELRRDGWLSIVHPDDAPAALEAWQHGLSTGQGEKFEQRLRRHDGEYRWHLVFGEPVRDARGEVRYWMGANVDIHDRKLAEERVAASEDRYRTLADSMDAIVCTASSEDGRLDFFNRRFYEYTGLDPAAMPDPPMKAIVHPDDYDRASARWQAARAAGKPFIAEDRLRRHDGVYRWHLTRGTPLQGEQGPRWMLTTIDIHDRRLAEERVAASEDRYRMLADSMDAMICMSSRENGVIDFFNRRFYEYTGLSPDAMPDVPMREVIHPDDFANAVRLWLEGRATGDPFEGEHRFRRYDGAYRWHLGRATHVPDPAGGRGVWLLTLVDIHDQKRTEEELRQSEARYRTLVDAAPVFVYNADAAGNATFVSESFYEYTGLSAADLRDAVSAIMQVVHPDDLPACLDAWSRATLWGTDFEIEARVLAADGVYRWFLTRLVAARDETGAATSWVGTSTNIDDRKHIEDALRESQKQYRALNNELREANATKDEFLGLVSHELKTPITTILGNAEVLHRRGGMLNDDARASALEDIQHDAERLHQIIENLLILARLERGRDVEMEPLLLRHVVEKLVADQRMRSPHRRIELRIDEGVEPVLAAQVYVEQVLRNLLSNAEKYSPAHLPIEVHLSCDHGRCGIDVLDFGSGIPEEERPFIFDPFWRSPAKEHVAGVGIGLAVCKRLIEAQGGEIAYLPREGGGSCFRVSLPCYHEDLIEA